MQGEKSATTSYDSWNMYGGNMNVRQTQFIAGVIAVAVFTLFAFAEKAPSLTPANSRKAAIDFTLQDSTGAPIRLSDYKGKIVLLDFWATWCHGCGTEIPWYMEFQNKYKDRGLSVIGVSMDDDGWKSVKPFITEHKVNYIVLIGNENLAKQYAVEQMPVTLLIDQDGRIAESHTGVVDRNAFESDIRSLLDEAQSKNGK
jgi:cytochrome c biogenesis protein CcmG/thiol:disulfide interchange protein DsbE